MTGSPSSNSGTQARHPNLLQQQGCRDNRLSDKLRRMAIKNAYESRSMCGASSIEPETTLIEEKPSPGKILLPSLPGNKSVLSASTQNSHRYSSSRSTKRPAQKTLSSPIASSRVRVHSNSPSTSSSAKSSSTAVHDVGARAGVDPKIIIHDCEDASKLQSRTASGMRQKANNAATNTGVNDDSSSTTSSSMPVHLRRSTSHSSVAVNGTATSSSLSQPMGSETSSYIYHVPGRMISRGRSRSQSRVHAHMHTHNIIPSLSLKRSSSHSTVALHRTNHYPIPLPSSMVHVPPSSAAATAPPPSLPLHGHGSPLVAAAVTTPLNYCNGAVEPDEPLYDSYRNHQYHRHHSGYGSQMHETGGGHEPLRYSRSLSQDYYSTDAVMPTTRSAAAHHAKRHNKIYEPWTPDIGLIESQFPRMFKHIEHTAPSGNRRRNKLDLPPVTGGLSQPDSLHYSNKYVAHRHSKKHRSPSSSSPSHHPRSLVELESSGGGSGVPTTQLGSSSTFQRSPSGSSAYTVTRTHTAPHLVSSPHHPHHPHHGTSRVAPPPSADSTVRRKRVTLHPPRGNKVASLV